MYAVIFKAELNELDDDYLHLAEKLRTLAMENYGCSEFYSIAEGQQEFTISYWPSLQHIQAWKQNQQHQNAQLLARSKWYKNYSVEVVKIEREYKFVNNDIT